MKGSLVHRDQCPEPEEIVRPNRYPGECDLCGGWVAESEGVAARQDTATVSGARYRARHDGYCPADPKPAPPEGGFTAQWTAHVIGVKDERWNPYPWVRELYKGRHGEQQTRRVRGTSDYSNASPDGSSGITMTFTLRPGHLYQAECVVERPRGRTITRRRERMYLIATPEGDVKMVTVDAEEVQEWLRAG